VSDEYSGKRVRCKECNTINNIPAAQSENVGSGDSVSELNKLLQEMAEDEKKAPGQEIEE
jgi:hypothetical protein